MEKLTYKEAETKIFDAYFKDEIKPYSTTFCFCGTLCNNTRKWFWAERTLHRDSHGYKGNDFVKMESALLNKLYVHNMFVGSENEEIYEDILFEAMCDALDVLRQIHIERGEIIDEPIVLKKRQLLMQT